VSSRSRHALQRRHMSACLLALACLLVDTTDCLRPRPLNAQHSRRSSCWTMSRRRETRLRLAGVAAVGLRCW
jgi:hypothetical protein